ncbi:MAG: restriction endonuclease subunit S [Cyanobacteriota bacterium]
MNKNINILDELAINITDGEHGSVIDDNNGNFYLLSNKNIINGNININNNDRKISEYSFNKIKKRTKLEKNDLVISTVGTIGKLAIIKDNNINYDFQRSVGIIKCDNEKLKPEYLYYYFSLPYIQKMLINLSKGAVQKCLFISDLKNLVIEYPNDIKNQILICNILSTLDKKIEINNRINEELEAMAKTLYDYWFVQFEFPNEEGKPYKSRGG